jgi:hypothetical protein
VATQVGAPVGWADTVQADSLLARSVTRSGQQRRHACCTPRRPPPPAQRGGVNNRRWRSCLPLACVLGELGHKTGQSTGPQKGGVCSPALAAVSSMTRRACGGPMGVEDRWGGGATVCCHGGIALLLRGDRHGRWGRPCVAGSDTVSPWLAHTRGRGWRPGASHFACRVTRHPRPAAAGGAAVAGLAPRTPGVTQRHLETVARPRCAWLLPAPLTPAGSDEVLPGR